jgi:hypothetical protein
MTRPIVHTHTVPCVVMRGGTTRGFFFQPKDIPSDAAVRDRMFLDVVMGQDLRQADGIGGGDMLLNKVVTAWASERPDVDVECAFGVITPGSARVKYGSNCGNLVSAVALFAVEEALRSGLKDTVRLFNPQSGSRVDARFMAAAEFRERAMGVKTMGMAVTGVPVELAFIDPAGTIGRGLLPTGEAVDRLALGSGVEIEASIVDCGTVYVFVAASDLGLDHATATLSARRQGELLEVAEKLRGQAAVLCGLADRPEDARRITPAVPKIAIVSPPHDYALDAGSQSLEAGDVDMLARIVSSQNLHKAYAVTGAIATIAAAVVPGSVVNRAVGRAAAGSPLALRIGHPGGVIEPRQDWHPSGDGVGIERTYMIRTARRIMTGSAHVADLVQVHPPVDLRTTRIWTSVPIRNANSAPQASSHRVRVR